VEGKDEEIVVGKNKILPLNLTNAVTSIHQAARRRRHEGLGGGVPEPIRGKRCVDHYPFTAPAIGNCPACLGYTTGLSKTLQIP